MAIPASAPQGLRTGPFRGSDAVRTGLLTKRQLDSSPWRRLYKDVYVHESVALTHTTRCQAVSLFAPPGVAISGRSAAHLLGAEVLGVNAPVEVTAPRAQRMASHPGVALRYSELRAGDFIFDAGVPTTTPVRTAFDIARRCELEEAVVAVDALIRACGLRKEAIAAYASDGRAAWHGARRLTGVLALACAGAESPMETRLRLTLVRAGLPPPVLQYRVQDETGLVVARLDLAYVKHRLGVEYDGECHWDPRAVRRDLRRQNALRALGWSLLRFTADDVLREPVRLAAQVEAVICRRSATSSGVDDVAAVRQTPAVSAGAGRAGRGSARRRTGVP
jgi:very-short-patch-repair endonuclease